MECQRASNELKTINHAGREGFHLPKRNFQPINASAANSHDTIRTTSLPGIGHRSEHERSGREAMAAQRFSHNIPTIDCSFLNTDYIPFSQHFSSRMHYSNSSPESTQATSNKQSSSCIKPLTTCTHLQAEGALAD